jgi:anthranilate/para-aminobenzoate synthase component II
MLIYKMVAQLEEDEDTFEVATAADLEFLGSDAGDESLLVILPGPSLPRLTASM